MRKRKTKITLKRNVKLFLIFSLVSVLMVTFNATFAKYISSTNATSSVDVAKFSFELKSGDTTLTDNFTYNLAGNITGGTNLSKSGLCPGKSGQIDMVINMKGTEVATRYAIYMNKKTNIPSNLKFYSDSSYTNEVNLGATSIYTDDISLANINTPVNKTIYWKWIWDESVTENEYEGTEFLFDIKVVVHQITG